MKDPLRLNRPRGNLERLFLDMGIELPVMIALKELPKYTGGMISTKTFFNILSDPNQPSPPTIKLGRRTGITREALIEWLRSTGRLTINNKTNKAK